MPLALTDDQLATVQRFAEPLHPSQRGAYLLRVSAILQGREIGDGMLHRACEQAQLEHRRTMAGTTSPPAASTRADHDWKIATRLPPKFSGLGGFRWDETVQCRAEVPIKSDEVGHGRTTPDVRLRSL